MSAPKTLCVAIAGTVALLGLAAPGAGHAAAERPSLPKLSAPLPVSATSYPFLAADHQQAPTDLAKYGYVEEEYLVTGQARVFDWPDKAGPKVLAKGPYTTRILVRRPKDARKFNGTAIVEPLNPSEDVDLPIMWAESYAQLMADGYAWVGVTIKPNTIKALQAFDLARYRAVAMPNPRPGASCPADRINASSKPTTPADESGLAWDMISQIGALLKAPNGGAVIGRPAARLYMTGQSQTAGYARTYATVFARSTAGPNGKPLYDGYLYSGSPPWQVPLNQCVKDLAEGDPRLLTGPAGAPVIELFTQGDMKTNVETRRPDSDKAPDLFRRYEVAGAAHVDPWERLGFSTAADVKRAHGRVDAGPPACTPADVQATDFPNRYVFDAAWRNLDRWVRQGVPAPHATPLELKPGAAKLAPDQQFFLDAEGNAKGGLRTPYVDVPTARWVGAKSGAFQCLFYGYKFPFDRAALGRLYGDHAGYVAKVKANVAQLQAKGWLTTADGAAIVREAEQAAVP